MAIFDNIFGDDEEEKAGGRIQTVFDMVGATTPEEFAAAFIYLPVADQKRIWDYIGKTGRGQLRDTVQSAKESAFKEYIQTGDESKLPPGVDSQGGGLGMDPKKLQSLLTSQGVAEAAQLQGEQPGIDAYTQDLITDPGVTSFLDRIDSDPGAKYDESVEGMNLTLAEQAEFNRDETGRDAQLRSLGDYDQIIAQEGLTDIDRARIEEMRQDTARRARAQEEAIMADAAERGRAGGNASLLLRNQAQQSATNTRALGDMQTAAMGLERKDQAIRNRGFLGGDIQAADDIISKFATEQSQAHLNKIADDKNKAEHARWTIEQGNKAGNVDNRIEGHAVDMGYEAELSDKNTNREIENEAGTDAGVRAHWGDKTGGFLTKWNVGKSGPAFNNVHAPPVVDEGDNGLAGAGQGVISGGLFGSKVGGGYGAAVGAVAGGILGYAGTRKRRTIDTGAW